MPIAARLEAEYQRGRDDEAIMRGGSGLGFALFMIVMFGAGYATCWLLHCFH